MKVRALVVTFLLAPAALAATASAAHSDGLATNGASRAGTTFVATPTLRLVSANPLVVKGVGFAPGERVTVTALTSLGPRAVRARATQHGTFRVLLGRFPQPCGKPFAVRARGAQGSFAFLRLAAPPCVPPPPR